MALGVVLLQVTLLTSVHLDPRVPRPAAQRSLPLLRFVGGDDGSSPITIRVRTRDGLQRATLPSADATLADLEKALRQEHRLSVQPGHLCRAPGGAEPLSEANGARSLRELGIVHGSMLHLTAAASAPPPPTSAASTTSTGAARSRRRKHTTMADFEAERSQYEVVLDTPKPASCSYVAVERQAAKRFSDYLLDLEFETRRVALLFGRWERATSPDGKSGVHVDVVYEPPQTCSATEVSIDDDDAGTDELMRAHAIAKGLGLSLVGIAYAHPPRFHAMEALELAFLARQRAKAIEADVAAAQLFVGMRFRPVYDDEPLDADVTAEVYQPTEQLCQLVLERDVVRDGGVLEGSGQLRLDAASKLEFKIGAQTQPTADASYFFARVHDLAKPYTPPAAGALRCAFPAANRGAPLRKFHLRTFLVKQREAGVPFESTIRDFQLLLQASTLLPREVLERTCAALAGTGTTQTVREKRTAALEEVERLLCQAAGLDVAAATAGAPANAASKTKRK